MSQSKLGNPAVVGLAGFGLTTLLLQFANLGLVGATPVIASAIIFGGAAQLFAGFQEMKVGNNFGFCAFSGYGAFWLIFALIKLLARYQVFPAGGNDMGWFLVAYTLFTAILWVASMKVHKAMFVTFSLLLIGFILLDLEHFGFPGLKVVASVELIFCALSALYMMAHVILLDTFGRDVLPVGGTVI
jgi:succinate-acetate transporter protein